MHNSDYVNRRKLINILATRNIDNHASASHQTMMNQQQVVSQPQQSIPREQIFYQPQLQVQQAFQQPHQHPIQQQLHPHVIVIPSPNSSESAIAIAIAL